MRIQSQSSHIIRYTTIVLFFVWVLLLGYVYYQFLISKTGQAPTKGGTLIEGVTSRITYVPYVTNSLQDSFYQSMLFRGCQTFFTSGAQVIYDSDLCHVITDDNKTYMVTMATGTRSDNIPTSIDDVLFTYQDVLQNNVWALPHGKTYANLSIQKLSNASLSIIFPRASRDNIQFFTSPILPAHILKGKDANQYTKIFAQAPTTNGCAKLSNSRDENSLIFDVGQCTNTWLKYYQVKNTTEEALEKNPGIIDMYIGNSILPGYNSGIVMTYDYAGLFFNMQRGKLSIYGRKNAIALLNKYLYLKENNLPVIKEHFLFDEYPTTITDKSTLTNIGSGQRLSGLQSLPQEITIPGSGTASYSLTAFEGDLPVSVHIAGDKIPTKAYNNYGHVIPMDDKTKGEEILLRAGDSISPGLNTIRFMDSQNNVLATLDIYYQTVVPVAKQGRIHLVYYTQDELHNHIATIMKNTVIQEGLADYFYFDGLPTAQAYTQALISKDYDITIQTLALGVKKDISSLFLVNDPLSNPSLYINANLASQINNYFQSPLETQYSIKPIINKLYNTDLPFFIIGKRITYLNTKPGLNIPEQTRWDDTSVREKIFHSIVSVYKPQITKQDLLSWKKFGSFIFSELFH